MLETSKLPPAYEGCLSALIQAIEKREAAITEHSTYGSGILLSEIFQKTRKLTLEQQELVLNLVEALNGDAMTNCRPYRTPKTSSAPGRRGASGQFAPKAG